MARQMLIDATRGKPTDLPPWLPYAGVHAAALIHQPADRYVKDAALVARGVVHAARLYQADGIPLAFDLSVEAESMGCRTVYWPDNVPTVTSHPAPNRPRGTPVSGSRPRTTAGGRSCSRPPG